MACRVIASGPFTTVQDGGRIGYRHLGLPTAGAMDRLGAEVANRLLDQAGDTALLEFTLSGPTLSFDAPTVIALVGQQLGATLDGQPVPTAAPVAVSPGQRLTVGPLKRGCRGYLAFKGGLGVPATLGSRATLVRARLGGVEGRALETGDTLPLIPYDGPVPGGISTTLHLLDPAPIRVIPGPQAEAFEGGVAALCAHPYRLSEQSDRMGCRLSGPPLTRRDEREWLTEGTVAGAIQVPPDGQPIVLMADGQPTGGYPKVAVVASVDLPRLAQARPGDTLTFVQVSVEDARSALRTRQHHLNRLAFSAAGHWRHP
ncbi:biotin-dependent carboxyltransferase family protein [Ferrimonas balearica]|uniref:5-oxoprolinase subunit C family protein n=1 Tax=Ferrimonas balearica TaxID=44012 RepID=UPI001C9A25E6|nr:biotin-dependent carboxyltransferase family protein [Ferrimonas balearica]MBY5990880.1 biotin-dependent carboxyltransferase family protein [Ferrimonas balearica]